MKKALFSILGVLAVVVAGGAIFLSVKTPAQRPAPAITIHPTPELLARGKYLFENVAECSYCHSKLDMTRWANPQVPGTEGAGGLCWDHSMGFPGYLCARNITPDKTTGVGGWTDGELARAIREGVDRDGKALFNQMPYEEFRHMSDGDVQAVIAYIRTLSPVVSQTPARKLDFPLPVLVKFMPSPLAGSVSAPPRSDEVAYGKYLVTLAGCGFCHSPVDDHMQPLPGRAFSGGHTFDLPSGGRVSSANLTPDPSGISGQLTREQFIARFKAYENPAVRSVTVDAKRNTVMPWLSFSGMTVEDLGAIYAYLKTTSPIHNVVEKFPAASVAAN